MKEMHLKILSLVLVALFVTNAQADGGDSSSGGDTQCIDYVNVAEDVAHAMITIGQEKINTISGVIKANDFLRIVQKPLRCVPGSPEELDNREARSYPDKNLTKLDVNKWRSKSEGEKIRLVGHELSVLSRYEKDGQYFISKHIPTILKKYPNDLQLHQYGEYANSYTINPDGSIFFKTPLVKGGILMG